jgi:hypothetical protein
MHFKRILLWLALQWLSLQDCLQEKHVTTTPQRPLLSYQKVELMASSLSSNLDNIRLVSIMFMLNHNYFKNACNYEIQIRHYEFYTT